MKKLLVNIDHIATLREARKESFPDPVQAATLVELGGGDGITVHLRTDRRHINERDLELLRKTIKTELNLEMAATNEMLDIALNVRPDIITLVPEKPEELT
ncbi:MAG: pyridoxine 5'-phosphate synthase, partial [candidate division WOR-3 bacterium]